MGLTIGTGISIFTVLLQGLLSFFSPCILPLVPLYVSYLAGTAGASRKRIFVNTLCFALGVSTTFFLLGFGFTALGQFFSRHRTGLAQLSGVIMILFGLYQLGLFGVLPGVEKQRRLPFRLDRFAMGPGPAYLLGFTFSFAWTPCVGPVLSSVLLMAGSAQSSAAGFALIGVYTIGFVAPFLLVGLFTSTVLAFLQKHQQVVAYTVKIGAVLLILMGVLTMTGVISGMTSVSLPQDGQQETTKTQQENEPAQKKKVAAPDFTLTDQNGVTHKLSDYRGKTVFLNFWATWCPNCVSEMGEIQAMYERYGGNQEDLVVLGIAAPNVGREGSVQKITNYLSNNQITFPTVMDETAAAFSAYGIRALPTTCIIDREGNVFTFVEGALTGEMMEELVQSARNP